MWYKTWHPTLTGCAWRQTRLPLNYLGILPVWIRNAVRIKWCGISLCFIKWLSAPLHVASVSGWITPCALGSESGQTLSFSWSFLVWFVFANGKLTCLVLQVAAFALSQSWKRTKSDAVRREAAGRGPFELLLAALAETQDEAFHPGWTGRSSRWTLAGRSVWGQGWRSLTLPECRSLGRWFQTRWTSVWIETSSFWAPAGTRRRRFLMWWSPLKSDWILLLVGFSDEARALCGEDHGLKFCAGII